MGGGGDIATSGSVVSLNSALGQAVAGPSSGGDVALLAGFWSGGCAHARNVYLPAVLKNLIHYAPPCSASNNYCEPYDTWQTAYGPLEPGVAYQAYPDDGSDYYYFELSTTRSVTIKVENYQATGDLILYKHREGDNPEFVAQWGIGGPTMTIGPRSLQAGKYYVRVYTTQGHNTTSLYTLTVAS